MIFFSVLTYELGRALGVEAAAREFVRQASTNPESDRIPAAAVAANLQRMFGAEGVMLYHPFGTRLAHLRSRCAHAFLSSTADVWVMCDDDVATDDRVLRAMVDIARSPQHPVVVLPCLVRGASAEERLNLEWSGQLVEQIAGHTVQRVARGGCGLMAVPRSALVAAAEFSDQYRDDDGEQKLAYFRDVVEGDRWLGEDLSFCARLRAADVQLVAPVDGQSYHAGMLLRFGGHR